MVPEIPLKIGNCQNNQAGSLFDAYMIGCVISMCDIRIM